MRSSIAFWFVTAIGLCLAVASCTLITEVDRGKIGEGGAGGMGGATP